jgi:hypothetical protein
VKGIRGKTLLALQPQPDTYLADTRLNRGGQLWKPFGRGGQGTPALLRLVYLPEIDNQTAAVTLSVQGTGVRQPFDPTPQASPVVLALPAQTPLPPVLIIESQAQGTLSLANVVQEYRSGD